MSDNFFHYRTQIVQTHFIANRGMYFFLSQPATRFIAFPFQFIFHQRTQGTTTEFFNLHFFFFLFHVTNGGGGDLFIMKTHKLSLVFVKTPTSC